MVWTGGARARSGGVLASVDDAAVTWSDGESVAEPEGRGGDRGTAEVGGGVWGVVEFRSSELMAAATADAVDVGQGGEVDRRSWSGIERLSAAKKG